MAYLDSLELLSRGAVEILPQGELEKKLKRAALRERFNFALTQYLIGTDTLDEAVYKIIHLVCEELGWEWGAFWARWKIGGSKGTSPPMRPLAAIVFRWSLRGHDAHFPAARFPRFAGRSGQAQ